ncbi:MAG: 7TM domain-containing protein, partial [Candidatus Binatia bacterium]
MAGWRALGALGGVLLGVPLLALVRAEDEKQIFPASSDATAPPAEFRPITTYWRVSVAVQLGATEPGAWFRLALPISTGRQAVLSREIAADGFTIEEVTEGPNLIGRWTRTEPAESSSVEVAMLAEVSELRVEPPQAPFPPPKPPAAMAGYLEPAPFIQSDDRQIRSRAREIVRAAKRLDEAAWALFQYTGSFLKTDPQQEKLDALSVLRDQKGSRAGKARLLIAMLRSVGIPARMVGGVRLADASKTRSTVSWVEAYLVDRWVPMDPEGGHFGYVPNNVLMLYRGDLPLIAHRSGLDLQYEVLVRQVTRKSVFEGDKQSGRSVLKPEIVSEVSEETDRVRTVASYLSKPVATVVVLTDDEVPQAVVDRMRNEAKEHEINLVLLVARFQSQYFRESYLQRMAAANLSAVRDAHMLLVSSRDEAGLYSLLGLGEGRVRLNDSRLVVSGSFLKPVGEVLGGVLYALFDPGELALFPDHADVLTLWEIGLANLIRGTPILEEAEKWGIDASVIDEGYMDGLSRYRGQIVEAWARAVRAQVPLQALNLILVLPVIAFVVVLCRNFIGIDTFGTFSPVIVSLAFLTTGLYWGVLIFIVIVGLGAALRTALQRLRLHLVARLAILIGLVSAVMTGLTVFGAYLGIGALLQVSLFPMVIMSNLIENFTASQVE